MIRFLSRLGGALALAPYLYEDVEEDESSAPQAFLIVLAASLATGAAYFPELGWRGLFAGSVAALTGWLAWSWLTYYIGESWLPGRNTSADWGQLLRTTGFAAAPGVLRLIGIVPEARDPIFALTWIWMLASFTLAVRQALDYESLGRAVLVSALGAAVYLGVLLVLPRACQLLG